MSFGSLNSSDTVGQGCGHETIPKQDHLDPDSDVIYLPSSAYPKVYKQSFWMRGWGSSTAKRTTLWANSSAVRFFSTTKKAKGKKSSKQLADIYYDASGRKRYKGNKALRASQYLVPNFLQL